MDKAESDAGNQQKGLADENYTRGKLSRRARSGSKLEELQSRLENIDRKHAEFLTQIRQRVREIHELQVVILTANAEEKGVCGIRYS